MDRLVLVHGSVSNGPATWSAQRPLGDRYELVVLNRPGFPPGPPVERVDFETDAEWVAEQLQPGDHLCGHSYGGVVSLLTAAAAPELRSLTVIEPPATSVARGHPAADDFAARAIELWRDGPREPEAFLRIFLRAVGSSFDPPSPLPPELEQAARTLMVERGPWEAEIPLADAPRRAVPEARRLGRTPRGVRRRSATCSSASSAQSAPRLPGRRSHGPAGTRLQREPGGIPRARQHDAK